MQRHSARARILVPAAAFVSGMAGSLSAWSAPSVSAQGVPPAGPPNPPGPAPAGPPAARPGPPARPGPFPDAARLPRTGAGVNMTSVGAALLALAGAAGGVVLRRRAR